jgi:hypothetical protein
MGSVDRFVEVCFRYSNQKPSFIGRIKGIRSFHQFNPKNDGTILCRRTSNSVEHDVFTLQHDEQQAPSVQPVRTQRDIVVDKFVIVEHEHKLYLAQVSALADIHQQVEVQCYKPSFPHSSYLASYTKMRSKLTIDWSNVIAFLTDQPKSGRPMQVLLSNEQIIEIHSLCS